MKLEILEQMEELKTLIRQNNELITSHIKTSDEYIAEMNNIHKNNNIKKKV